MVNIRRVIALLALSGSVLSWDGCSAADWALIVGVNECPRYQLPHGIRPRPLKGAERDAQAFGELLRKRFGFGEAHLLQFTGEKATRQNVRNAFARLQREVTTHDTLVFYFSGHGTQVTDLKPFEESDDLDEALCLADAQANGDGLMIDDELGLHLGDIVASRTTVILDCCHAGTGTKELDDDCIPRFLPGPQQAVPAVSAKPAWLELQGTNKGFSQSFTALFACQPNQLAYERRLPLGRESVRAGQFTFYLSQGLETGAADGDADGRITAAEAHQYVTWRINETFNDGRPTLDQQVPVIESDRQNGLLFGR